VGQELRKKGSQLLGAVAEHEQEEEQEHEGKGYHKQGAGKRGRGEGRGVVGSRAEGVGGVLKCSGLHTKGSH